MMKQRNAGFGMIPMLIALAVGGMIVAGLATGITTMLRSQKSVELSQDASMLADELTTVLGSESACTAAFANQPAPTTATPVEVNSTVSFASGPKTLAKDQEFVRGTHLATYALVMTPDSILTVAGTKRQIVTLRLNVAKDERSLFVNVTKVREIRLHTMVDASNRIVRCKAESDDMKACDSTGGFFDIDPATPIATRCLAYRHCRYGGSYANAPVSEGGFPNQLTGGMSCPNEPAEQWTHQRSGAITKAVSTGKSQIGNQYTPVVTCMQCLSVPSWGAPGTVVVDAGAGMNDQIREDDETQSFIADQLECRRLGRPLTYPGCEWNQPR